MYIYLLLLFFFVGLIVCYKVFDKDIMSPAVIYFFVYLASILCTIYNINKWGVNLSLKTFLILSLGAIEFAIVSYLVFQKFKNEKSSDQNKKSIKIKEIKVDNWKIYLILLYSVVAIIALIYNIHLIAEKFGNPESIKETLSIYKDNASYKNNASLSQITSLLIKPLFAFAYINLFIFINNIIASKKNVKIRIKNNILYLLPVLAYIIQNLINSYRSGILNLGVAAFIMYGIIWSFKNNWSKKIPLKSLVYILVIGVVGLLAFYLVGMLIGRRINSGFIDYITMYCGGSIQLFDMYIKEPVEKASIIGYETFFGFIINLHKFFHINIGIVPTGHLEWRFANGYNVGNVYTSFRRWYQDFGYAGIIVLQSLLAAFYTWSYYMIKRMQYNRHRTNICIIYYSYFCYSLFTHFIDSTFYSFTFRLAFISQFIVFLIVYIFELILRVTYSEGAINIKLFNYKKSIRIKKNKTS